MVFNNRLVIFLLLLTPVIVSVPQRRYSDMHFSISVMLGEIDLHPPLAFCSRQLETGNLCTPYISKEEIRSTTVAEGLLFSLYFLFFHSMIEEVMSGRMPPSLSLSIFNIVTLMI
ncbi:hypothetical protein SK128_000182 [Halocaridina rubra]|uniref:Uncharacterized protein n=1 Tax=Halocaridina rubra TaxID=373956 RepID=A0AAN8X2P6_HALRR